jgi:hypothetical protein
MSNKKYEYEEGQRVYFNIDGKTKGWGFIRGCCGDYPTIGRQWIVEVQEPAPYDEKTYPFSALSVFSIQLRLQPFDLDGNPLAQDEEPTNDSDVKSESEIK